MWCVQVSERLADNLAASAEISGGSSGGEQAATKRDEGPHTGHRAGGL